MYEPDTILALKKPRDPDPETGEPFPYNEVKVIGQSPVSHSGTASGGSWSGTEAAGVIVTPLSGFGSTLDEPYGKLVALYDVAQLPETEVELAPKIRVINSTSGSAGPTPEERFAVEAPGKAPVDGQKRARTSPLDDPRPKAGASILDEPPTDTAQASEPDAEGAPQDPAEAT